MKGATILLAVWMCWTAPCFAETIVCGQFSGKRIDWFPANQALVSPEHRGKTAWNEDAIDGLVAALTWSTTDNKISFSTSGNQNDGGGVAAWGGTKIMDSDERKVFMVWLEQPHPDNAVVMLTFYPRAMQILWAGHGSQFLIFKGGMHGKYLVGKCNALSTKQ